MLAVIQEEGGQAIQVAPEEGTVLIIDGEEYIILDKFCEVSDALKYLVAINTKGDIEVLRSMMLNRHNGKWYQCKASESEIGKFSS